ncbi:MAG TPA: hypothetical protein VK481_06785, partial [Gemmatimonadaceae bacterium]|nr:hypothetical protein [Gemmatimonadaceae bacterium]
MPNTADQLDVVGADNVDVGSDFGIDVSTEGGIDFRSADWIGPGATEEIDAAGAAAAFGTTPATSSLDSATDLSTGRNAARGIKISADK